MSMKFFETVNEFDADEYESLFPYDQEYNSWMADIEADYVEECEFRAGIAVPNDSTFVLHSTDEDLSPFITVNS